MKATTMGEGPAIVLLPGLGCDDRLWQPVAERLKDRFMIVQPEVWGAGSLRRAAQGVRNVVDGLGLRTVGVAGLSMGGYVAFELLRLIPESIAAAVLLDTTAYPDTAKRAEKRMQVLRLLEGGRFSEVLGAFIPSVLSPDNAAGGPVRELMEEMAHAVGAVRFAADSRAIAERGSFVDVLRGVSLPLLFACGDEDALTPPEVARRMASEAPRARAEVIPGAAHMAPIEAPARVAELLSSFFLPYLRPGA